MTQYTESEKEALALVNLKTEEREASAQCTRLRNALNEAEKTQVAAQQALKVAREAFIRKMS